MNAVNYHFIDSLTKFSDHHRTEIIFSANECVRCIERFISLDKMDVIFLSDKKEVIPDFGIGGYSPNHHTVFIYFDTDKYPIDNDLLFKMQRLLAHEINHCLRYTTTDFGKTLGEQVISEGIADNFSLEVIGGVTYPWCKSIKEEDLPYWIDELKQRSLDVDVYKEWFHNFKGIIPKWVGYSLGFHIVRTYLDKHPGLKAHNLINVQANEILNEFYKS